MIESHLPIGKEYEFNKRLIDETDSIIDSCIRDCHKKYFQTLKYKRVYDKILTYITNIEKFNLTISGKSMNFFDLNE